MIVVAVSSPLHYLILLEQTALLPNLYGHVLAPETIAAELRAARAPEPVRAWMSRPPSLIEIIDMTTEEIASVPEELDPGERAAIALAEKVRADLIVIDETDGRAEAIRRNFRVTGTLGILRAAALEGLVDVRSALNRLAATNFYTDERLLVQLFGEWLTE